MHSHEKADTDDGWFKFASDLCEKIARTDFTEAQYAVAMWVLWHTYGNRKKDGAGPWTAERMTPYSIQRIAKDLGRKWEVIRDAGRAMESSDVLKLGGTEKEPQIGFNTKISEWRIPMHGREFEHDYIPRRRISCQGTSPKEGYPPAGEGYILPQERVVSPGRRGSENARTESSELTEGVPTRVNIIPEVNVSPQPESSGNGPGKAPTPHPAGPPAPPRKRTHWEALMPHAPLGRHWRWGDPQPDTWNEGMVKWAPLSTTPGLLPSGRRDSVRERGLLGHPEYYPADHKDWNSTSFETRDDAEAAWRNANAAVIRLAKHEDLIPFDRAQNAGTLYDVMNAAIAAAPEPVVLGASASEPAAEAIQRELEAEPEPEPALTPDQEALQKTLGGISEIEEAGKASLRRQAARAKALRQAGGLVSDEGSA